MTKYKILWADDEIDLLKPHILFLTGKGYDITSVKSGTDALEQIDHNSFDLVFLDENMPGMTGLETLNYIKSTHPFLPVVMITKSEEEYIMDEAIGSKIADYLIKPLNPNQILLSAKKLLDNQRIITEKTNLNYQQEFARLSMQLQDNLDFEEWVELYRKLIYWELQIDTIEDKSMSEVLHMQKSEANREFAHFISDNYKSWINREEEHRPLLSHEVMEQKVLPLINDRPTVMIVIDNLRLDQWDIIETEILRLFDLVSKEYYYSILPTTTAYARNSLFAGLTPSEIENSYSELWVGEDSDKPKNNHEEELIRKFLERNHKNIKFSYNKIIHAKDGKNLSENVSSILANPFGVIVYNFVDMLSHARTDMQMIRQLAPDESAYRALTKTWFEHSSLFVTLKKLSENKINLVITTDHGTIRVKRPEKIIGDRNTNTNLRFKLGKNLNFDESNVFFSREPDELKLPKLNVSTSYAFAKEDRFFAYPNNFNYYVNFYKDTFQHGGISMEEMIVPLIFLSSKE